MIFPKRQLNVTSRNPDFDHFKGTEKGNFWLNKFDPIGCKKNLCRQQLSTTYDEMNFIDLRMKISRRNYDSRKWTAIFAIAEKKLENFQASMGFEPLPLR